jgi:hypothetical protein
MAAAVAHGGFSTAHGGKDIAVGCAVAPTAAWSGPATVVGHGG